MKKNRSHRSDTHTGRLLVRATLATAMLLAVVWATPPRALAAEASEVKQVGEYVAKQTVPEAEVVLGYRYATKSAGQEWLILELALTSPPGETARITRENVFLRTPDGTRIPLPGQKEFAEAYAKIQNQIARANVARDPMDYFPPNREQCSIQFFEAPGQGVVYDQVTVNSYRACQGKLFFKVPGGLQPGRYTLGIDLEESQIRIPFEIPGA
jgi:hypothetical protein